MVEPLYELEEHAVASSHYWLRLPRLQQEMAVQHFTLHEALSEAYSLEVALFVSEALGALVHLIDQPVCFQIRAPTVECALAEPARLLRYWQGIVREVRQEYQSRDVTRYRFWIAPRVMRLADFTASRLFQNKSVPAIVEAMLRHHGFTESDFGWRLTVDYPVREYTTQYRETDWAFIQRLLHDEGIWYTFEQGEQVERLLLADSPIHYKRNTSCERYREPAGLESDGREAVTHWQVHYRAARARVRLMDYNYRVADHVLDVVHAAPPGAPAMLGSDTHWGEHYTSYEQGARMAGIRYEASLAEQCQADGGSNVLCCQPGRVMSIVRVEEAQQDWLVTRVMHMGSCRTAYRNQFKAIPAERVYRPPLTVDWPVIAGTLPARVTSPGQYPYAYLDEWGRYRVKLPFDLDTWNPGGESRPVRLARSYAGAQYGQHFPLHPGTEVMLAFVDGNPDRPYIAGVMHDSTHPDLVPNTWQTRNVLRTWGNNKLRMEDKQGQQHIKLATAFHNTQVNLGHIVDSQRRRRGEGFELRSEGWGVLRAAKGLLLSAEEQASANQDALEMKQAMTQLHAAQTLSQSLGRVAQTAGAYVIDGKTQQELLENTTALKKAALIATAPSGIALTSGASAQLAATDDMLCQSGQHMSLCAQQWMTLTAGDGISVLAQNADMKLIAVRGELALHAQEKALQLSAAQQVSVTSERGRVSIHAQEELLLSCAGAYIRLKDGHITIGCPGDSMVHSVTWQKHGPSTLSQEYNHGASTPFSDDYFLCDAATGEPLAQTKVDVVRQDGTRLQYTTDASGKIPMQKSDRRERLTLRILGLTIEDASGNHDIDKPGDMRDRPVDQYDKEK